VEIMHAKFQASSFNDVGGGGGGGDRWKDGHQAFLKRSLYKISKLSKNNGNFWVILKSTKFWTRLRDFEFHFPLFDCCWMNLYI